MTRAKGFRIRPVTVTVISCSLCSRSRDGVGSAVFDSFEIDRRGLRPAISQPPAGPNKRRLRWIELGSAWPLPSSAVELVGATYYISLPPPGNRNDKMLDGVAYTNSVVLERPVSCLAKLRGAYERMQ